MRRERERGEREREENENNNSSSSSSTRHLWLWWAAAAAATASRGVQFLSRNGARVGLGLRWLAAAVLLSWKDEDRAEEMPEVTGR